MRRKSLTLLLVFGLAVVAVSFFLLTRENKETFEVANQENLKVTPENLEPELMFGFPVDSFVIHEKEIKKNQFLADILLGYDLSYQEIDHLVKEAKDTFDVRNMRSGKKYAVFCSQDSIEKAKVFVYQPNAVDYVVFDLRDSVNVYKGHKEVTTRKREASGVIKSSLFQTLVDNKLSPALAMKMADVYAWTIDFYRIQKGDYFKVIFEEKYVEDEFIGIGNIETVLFNNYGEDFYAFTFEQDSITDFYDEKGQSLRKAFLKSPLKFGRLTSAYTKRRFHPVQRRWKAHLGTDYAAPRGTPILAVGDGVVTEARYKKYNGNYVKIKHNGTYTTQYLHMHKIGKGIRSGKRVRQGDVIGYVGSTGLATGPHVCFRFWKHGKQVDHRREKLPASKPVKPENKAAFTKVMEVEKKKLDKIQIEDKEEQKKLASN